MLCCVSVKYVRDEYLKIAQEMEQKFTSLPKQAGVVFISVRPVPEEDGHVKEYWLYLGIPRSMAEGTGRGLVAAMLAEEMKSGRKIYADVLRGSPGACRDAGS